MQNMPSGKTRSFTAHRTVIGLADSAAAAVLPPNLPDSEPCDWVEGIEDLAELVDLVESGEYEALLAADDEGGHAHECGCGCHHH